MIGAPNSLNLNCKVRVMREVPGPSVSEEIADIFRNYNIDSTKFGSTPKLWFFYGHDMFIYIYTKICIYAYTCTHTITRCYMTYNIALKLYGWLLTCWIHFSQQQHNKRDSVSNHQPYDCLLNRLFRRRSKKTSKLRVTGLCEGNSPVTGEFTVQRTSNSENVSIWWRHHGTTKTVNSTTLLFTVDLYAIQSTAM